MYMAMADDRIAIEREPVRVVGMGGLGFAPILAAAGASGGPAGWVVAGVGAAIMGIAAAVKAIFSAGHKDDAVGEADGVLMGQVVAPILSEILGGIQVQGTWMDVDPKTDMVAHLEEANHWPLTADRTATLINWADQAIAAGCQHFAAAGYPCHIYTGSGSGAATLAYTKWQRLKSYMQIGLQQAQAREATAQTQPPQQPTGVPAVGPAAQTAGPTAASISSWFSGNTVIGGQPIPNAMLAVAGGVAIAFLASK